MTRKTAPPIVSASAGRLAAVDRTVNSPLSISNAPFAGATSTSIGKLPVERATAENVIVSPGGAIVMVREAPSGKSSFGDDTPTITRTGNGFRFVTVTGTEPRRDVKV